MSPRVSGDRVRVLRVIARMNIGGPAYHVSLLSGRLDPERYETLLVSGRMGSGEGSFDSLAQRYGARHEIVKSLGPEPRPLQDLRAVYELARIVRAFRPDIVHTHTAKAGLVGRFAARLVAGRRPIVIHTYHGHVLEGYFGRFQSGVYRFLEQALALVSDRLIAVSSKVADDLVRLRVTRRERFRVVALGLELDRFLDVRREEGEPIRAELGIAPETVLLTTVGRLVPIKRIDVLLDAVAEASAAGAPVHLLIVGDGPSRAESEQRIVRLGIADRVTFFGFRTDLPAIQAATDIAVLSSDNEGTPVALIEAAAAARPAAATNAGGVADVVTPETGRTVPTGDVKGLANAFAELAADAALRERLGTAARAHVRERFAHQRLLADIDELYQAELARRR